MPASLGEVKATGLLYDTKEHKIYLTGLMAVREHKIYFTGLMAVKAANAAASKVRRQRTWSSQNYRSECVRTERPIYWRTLARWVVLYLVLRKLAGTTCAVATTRPLDFPATFVQYDRLIWRAIHGRE